MSDQRADPFWEFGSLGRTGCYRANLLHPRRTPLADGDRLAFLQGGVGEIPVVGLSPPIKVGGSTARIELKWPKNYRPLRYSDAPLLISNSGHTAFSKRPSVLAGTRR